MIVHLEESLDLELAFTDEDEMECEVEVQVGAWDSVSVFDVPPPTFPLRIVVASFELKSEKLVDVFFQGNVRPFQEGFQKALLGGQSYKVDPKEDSSDGVQ